uniref:Uncharacterized protein n=3 Tax=Vibrionaceae TaxID=641 RepID=A0A0H3ZKM6_VIBSP|nr:hypothetical protein [Vibrio splendidus]AKN37906.1 hypothetical protein [Vibrio sp. FF_482]AKN37945.1 hypothetical protein [Enterovibrio norvegicus]
MPSLSIDNILGEVRAACLHAPPAETRRMPTQPARYSCARYNAQPEH